MSLLYSKYLILIMFKLSRWFGVYEDFGAISWNCADKTVFE